MDEKIITRIRKMIKLRDDKAASQGEIENATALVQKMLIEHNLTIDQISDKPSKYDKLSFNPGQRKREGKFIPSLYNIIARYHFCFIVISGKYDNPNDRKHQSYTINIIGTKSDVEVVEYMCSWLAPKIRQMANDTWKSYYGPEKEGRFKRGYYLGCVSGIASKLEEQKEKLKAESGEITSLVLRADIKLKEAVKQHYPHLKSTNSKLSSRDGNNAGFRDGRNIRLNKGLAAKKRGIIE